MTEKKRYLRKNNIVRCAVLALQLFGVANRFVALFKVEAYLMKRNLVFLVAASLFFWALCLSLWFSFLVLLFFYFISLHMSILLSLSMIVIFNVLLLISLGLVIMHVRKHVSFSETRDQVVSFISSFLD
jgi:hypothetical protein